jgi:hypothetical protein
MAACHRTGVDKRSSSDDAPARHRAGSNPRGVYPLQMNSDTNPAPPKLLWPRYALAGLVAFLCLNALWVWREVERVKRHKAAWSASTNALPAQEAQGLSKP